MMVRVPCSKSAKPQNEYRHTYLLVCHIHQIYVSKSLSIDFSFPMVHTITMKRNRDDDSAILYLILVATLYCRHISLFFHLTSGSNHCISNCPPRPEICSAGKLGNIQCVRTHLSYTLHRGIKRHALFWHQHVVVLSSRTVTEKKSILSKKERRQMRRKQEKTTEHSKRK